MFARIFSASLLGVDAVPVRVEAHVGGGTSSFRMTGLPAKTVREAERRVRAALCQCGFELPSGAVTVHLAPAELPKDGSALDLAIAVALLLTAPGAPRAAARGRMFLGELGLDGGLRPVRGAIASAHRAKREGLKGLVLPVENTSEAGVVRGLQVWGATSLFEVLELLQGERAPAPVPPIPPSHDPAVADLRDVRGQQMARRAVEIAAAGAHNLLLFGPPGTGKSMLAARLPGVLPVLEESAAVEATKVHSAAGLLPSGVGLLRHPPFRAPHHTVSYAGLLGGGSIPRPGEVSLAHQGVLYLDEMAEFHRPCLEGLRQPMETGEVHIARGGARAVFPARFLLVGSTNPCPCGYQGDPKRRCRCTPRQIERYRGRISGPLLDRFDLLVEVPAVPVEDLLRVGDGEPSKAVRQRVLAARARAARRFRSLSLRKNADLDVAALEAHARPEPAADDLLRAASNRLKLSARAIHRVLRVGLTIADLNARDRIGTDEIAEALQFRWSGPDS